MSKPVEGFRQLFSSTFRSELNAVEARRRRYRIEQTLGRLPEVPQPLPLPTPIDLPAAAAPPPTLDEIQKKQEEMEKARRKLAEVRRSSPKGAPAETPPSSSAMEQGGASGLAVAAAAREYHRVAREWYDLALLSLAAPSQEPQTVTGEQAESILQSAAKALADAAVQANRELPDAEAGAEVQQLARQVRPAETELRGALAADFGLVLAWEQEAQTRLEALCQVEEEKCRADEALRLVERWREALYHLARAEQLLFQKARCWVAADAAKEEVQKRLREWNKARSLCPPSPPPEAWPPSSEGQTPPSNPPHSEETAGGEEKPTSPDYAPGGEGPPDGPLASTREAALGLDLVGLALSGGGIRSATFGLGVLQGLAQLRLLGTIDFLSTVSGGGYIGSWFAAWVRREGSLANVEKQLSPNRVSQSLAERYEWDGRTRLDKRPRDEEPEPVHHLRAYSRYLSPRFGLFFPDTWTLFTIYLRNLFVNALFFLPLAVFVVFAWRLLLYGYIAPLGVWEPSLDREHLLTWRFGLTALFGAAFALGIGCLAWEEENLFEADMDRSLRDGYAEAPKFTYFIILLLLLVVAVLGSWLFSLDPDRYIGKKGEQAKVLSHFGQNWLTDWFSVVSPSTVAQFPIAFVLIALWPSLGVRLWRWGRRCWKVRDLRSFNWHGLFSNVLLAFFFGLAMFLVIYLVIWPLPSWLSLSPPGQMEIPPPDVLCLLHAIGVPVVLVTMVLGGFAEMAVVGRLLSEYEREWRSRLAAYLLMAATAWLLMAAAVFLVPWAVERISAHLSPATLKGTLAAIWAAISGGGAWLAQRRTPDAQGPRPAWWSRLLMTVAPAVFLIGLCGGVSAFGQEGVKFLTTLPLFEHWAGPAASSSQAQSSFFAEAASWPGTNGFLVGASLVLFWTFGFLINVNRFSMHMLYANRLTRCYLGASARKQRSGSRGIPTGVKELHPPSPDRTHWPRLANYFTGFDPLDDFPLAELRLIGGRAPYTGPVPLINSALNCLAGDELAYQDRRADAFLFTPEWCGGLLTGYARTPHTASDATNLTLGRVMTISGAAVDPNMSHLSPPLTALMTLFNTRLGWWLENPDPTRRPWNWRQTPWAASEPGIGFRLLGEFLGRTNEDSAYVHVSDGGHFENLGVYELIRRRCRFIVVADAGTDRMAASDNMAAMLQLIRTDFGVRIELDPARMQLAGSNSYSAWHCCVGRIRYDEVDEKAVPGLMVYLQATLTGDEPPDLLQYVARHPHFPRQSTLNQFFDEAQFEAYRVLGHHIVSEVFGEAAAAWTGAAASAAHGQDEVRSVFARLREQWLPPLDCESAEWIAAAEATVKLERHQDGNAALAALANETYQEVNGGTPPIPPAPDPLPEFRAVSQTLQVMELAWRAMKLDVFHAHPLNRGWMNTFRRWTTSRAFHRYWPFLRAEYSRPFVRFCEDILNLETTTVDRKRLVVGPLSQQTPQIQRVLAKMDDHFFYEWADQFDLLKLPAAGFQRQGFIADLLGRRIGSPLSNKPLAWLIEQEETLPCGVVCVARTPRQRLLEPSVVPGEEAEFFFWLSGPYRSMGIGREAAAEALRDIDEEFAFQQDAQRLRRLVAYYPQRNATAGCRLELQRWMDFCFDLGFRRERQPERGLGAKFVIVKRRIV